MFNLPKGFNYLTGDELIGYKFFIFKFLNKKRVGVENKIEFPPVSFSEMFNLGAHITGEKTYVFHDKSNRELVLTPDSQAHMYNYYLSLDSKGCLKSAWFSPIFRYRNIKKRYWHQVGLSSINHDHLNEIDILVDFLLEIQSTVIENYNGKIKLNIYCQELVREIFEKHFLGQHLENDYESFRINPEDYLINFKSNLDDRFFVFFDSLTADEWGGMDFVKLEKLPTFLKLKNFVNKINEKDLFELEFKLQKFYSSETMSGIGFEMFVDSTVKIGDGGIYNRYANNFNKNLSTSISICLGQGITYILNQSKI